MSFINVTFVLLIQFRQLRGVPRVPGYRVRPSPGAPVRREGVSFPLLFFLWGWGEVGTSGTVGTPPVVRGLWRAGFVERAESGVGTQSLRLWFNTPGQPPASYP